MCFLNSFLVLNLVHLVLLVKPQMLTKQNGLSTSSTLLKCRKTECAFALTWLTLEGQRCWNWIRRNDSLSTHVSRGFVSVIQTHPWTGWTGRMETRGMRPRMPDRLLTSSRRVSYSSALMTLLSSPNWIDAFTGRKWLKRRTITSANRKY